MPPHFTGMDHQLEDLQVAVIRAGLPEKRRREEMRFIHNFGTLAPGWLNQEFSFTWLAHAHIRLFLSPHFQIFKFSAITRTHIFSLIKAALPKRRGFIWNYQRLTYHLPTFNTHKRYAGTPQGGLPYMGYIGVCRCEGYGFQAVYSGIQPRPQGFSLTRETGSRQSRI